MNERYNLDVWMELRNRLKNDKERCAKCEESFMQGVAYGYENVIDEIDEIINYYYKEVFEHYQGLGYYE